MNSLTKFHVAVLLISLFSCQSENLNQNEQSFSGNKEIISGLDKLFERLYEEESFNGNVLVAMRGEVIFERSYGLANESSGDHLQINSVFDVASITKQFTAIGIVLLKKEGKLSYDDRITDFIPELKGYGSISIRHLLNHTSGLPDYISLAEESWDKSNIAQNKDIIELFVKFQPEVKFKPNDQWEYSNTGYLLLASVIERVSGKSYEDFLTEVILKPVGLKNTYVHRRRYDPKQVEHMALGYITADSLKKKILPDELGTDYYAVYLDGIVGDGMINSTIRDLLIWDRALYSNVLLDDSDRRDIFSSYSLNDGTESNYGFGWAVDSSEVFGKIVAHSGGWAGFVSYFERHIDHDLTIILLQNNFTEKTTIPVDEIREILYDLI